MTINPTHIARLLRNEVAHCQASLGWAQEQLEERAAMHAKWMRETEIKRGLLRAAIDQQQEWTRLHPETQDDALPSQP